MNFFDNTITDLEKQERTIALFKEYQAQAINKSNNSFLVNFISFWFITTCWLMQHFIFPESSSMKHLMNISYLVTGLFYGFILLIIVFNPTEKINQMFISSAEDKFKKNWKINATVKYSIWEIIKNILKSPSLFSLIFTCYIFIAYDQPIMLLLTILFYTTICSYALKTNGMVVEHIAQLWDKKCSEKDKEKA